MINNYSNKLDALQYAGCHQTPLIFCSLPRCRYPACSMTDVAARELATVSISDYGEDDDVTYSSRFDPWIEQSQVEPTVIKQQS